MTTKQVSQPQEKEKALTSIHESIFWNEDDPRWRIGKGASVWRQDRGGSHGPLHIIDMKADSYIWLFSGSRGAGKTTAMTYYALKTEWSYGCRLLSNYPIEYRLKYSNGGSRVVRAEVLDLYRLLCFDEEYKNCLILIDEAPDIISHMAAMTWKNRLLNIFVRQLRKNHNSLFLGAQQFELIDKSLRWQTDILAECQDASRKYGWGSEHRGKCILVRLKDNSGMWTGESYDESVRRQNNSFVRHFKDPSLKKQLYPRVLWGDEDHKPVYDTFFTQDVWESLKKVDMKLGSYQVGKKEEGPNLEILKKASPFIEKAIVAGRVNSAKLYREVDLNPKDKRDLGARMRKAGVDDCPQSGWLDFTNFDWGKFANAYGVEVEVAE